MTAEEIRAKYKKTHDEMEAEFYPLMSAGLIDDELKAIFDTSHGQNWNDMEAELIAEGHLKPPEPAMDYGKEIDEIKAKIADYDELKSKVEALEKK